MQVECVTYRAIEAVAHKWCQANAGETAIFKLRNTDTGAAFEVEIAATPGGRLREDSVAGLRKAKRRIDRGTEYDGRRVYNLYFKYAVGEVSE